MRSLEDQTFLLLLIAVSFGFGWLLLPYYEAALWAVIAAVVFAPLNRALLERFGGRRTLAALLCVIAVVAIVIVPVMVLGASILREISGFYESLQSGQVDVGRAFQSIVSALPAWAVHLLERVGLTNLAGVQSRLSSEILERAQALAGHAVSIGQTTLDFVTSLAIMLYLLFFLLRDGEAVSRRIRDAVPLRPAERNALFEQFSKVIRATVKGDILVAAAQGALGGLIFWLLDIHAALLLAVLMAFASLVPAVGAALIWLPVAIYDLATGSIWEGALLIAYGAVIIGLTDNVLRPILVGKDTRMPDYVVLISTLGGLSTFGPSGLVIGPVIAAMFLVTWSIFSASRHTTEVTGSRTGLER